MTDARDDMAEAIRREQAAEREHRRVQGQDPDAERETPAERSRDEAIERASRDVERSLGKLDEHEDDSHTD